MTAHSTIDQEAASYPSRPLKVTVPHPSGALTNSGQRRTPTVLRATVNALSIGALQFQLRRYPALAYVGSLLREPPRRRTRLCSKPTHVLASSLMQWKTSHPTIIVTGNRVVRSL